MNDKLKATCISIIIILVLSLVVTFIVIFEKSRMEFIYKSWCKHTGNTSEPTIKEFYVLRQEKLLNCDRCCERKN